VVAPAYDESVASAGGLADRTVVAGSDRVVHGAEPRRVGGPQSEDVDDLHGVESPGPGESETPGQRGIQHVLIGGGGVETDKSALW